MTDCWPGSYGFGRTRWNSTGHDKAPSENGPQPLFVPLTERAADHLEKFARLMAQRKETVAGLMRSTVGKARGLTLRVAHNLNFLHWSATDHYTEAPKTTPEEYLLAAAKFVAGYVMPMAERTYGDAACSDVDRNTATLAKWIAKTRPSEVYV